MAIGAQKSSGAAIAAMPDGVNQAVISGIRELGVVSGEYGDKYTIVAEFTNSDGEKASRFYTGNAKTKKLSLAEKSNLAADLKALFGKVPDSIDDVEKLLLGRQVQVVTTQYKNKNGYINAKVNTVTRPVKDQEVHLPAASAAPKAAKPAPAVPSLEITDDDIPF